MTNAVDYSRELAVAIEAARKAGEATERHFHTAGGRPGAREKAPGDPVTDADIESNAVIHAIIAKEFPDDGWLSEETRDTAERLGKKRVWIVDPIDGTKEFVAGVPEYSVSIGFAVNGRLEVGVVIQPTQNRLYAAERSGGLRLENVPSPAAGGSEAKPRILVSRTETKKGEWAPFAAHFEMTPCGSIAYKLARVAAGEHDGVITLNPRSEWDIAAGALLVEAAGGEVRLRDGSSVTYNSPRPVTPSGIVAGRGRFVANSLTVVGV